MEDLTLSSSNYSAKGSQSEALGLKGRFYPKCKTHSSLWVIDGVASLVEEWGWGWVSLFRRICYPPAWSMRIYYPINKDRLHIADIERSCAAGHGGFKILILGSGG